VTTEVRTQALLAGVQATFGQGRFFVIKAAPSGGLTLVAERLGSGGTVRNFVNMPAGASFIADPGDGWTYLRVTSAVDQSVEICVGDDQVAFANAVSVTGTASVSVQPSSTVTTPADASIASAGVANIAANTSRKRIWVGSLSSNSPVSLNLRVHVSGAGAAKGFELQPGTYEKFETTAAITIFNGDANAQSYWVFEES
jgi:hypothetical protein